MGKKKHWADPEMNLPKQNSKMQERLHLKLKKDLEPSPMKNFHL